MDFCFKPFHVDVAGFTCILGKRGCGKTTYAKSFVQTFPNHVTVMARTEKARTYWREVAQHHPTQMEVHAPSLDILRDLRRNGSNQLIVIDDCGALAWFMDSPELLMLIHERRNILMTLQHLKHANFAVRENFDRIFLLGSFPDATVKMLLQEFVHCTTTDILKKCISRLSNDRGAACVIDNTTHGTNIEDILFHYRFPLQLTYCSNPSCYQFADGKFCEDCLDT